ncbi:MAG: hypothetical protein Q9164_006636 [Protoblastenia rupestris]
MPSASKPTSSVKRWAPLTSRSDNEQAAQRKSSAKISAQAPPAEKDKEHKDLAMNDENSTIISNANSELKRSGPSKFRSSKAAEAQETLLLQFVNEGRKDKIAIHYIYVAPTSYAEEFGRPVQIKGQAGRLKELASTFNLELILPLKTVTQPRDVLIKEGTTLDLVWRTRSIVEHVVGYEAQPRLQCSSDYIPIRTVFGYKLEAIEILERWNFKEMKKDRFLASLSQKLDRYRTPRTQAQLDEIAEGLIQAIAEAVDEFTPKTRWSPKMRPGWNDKCI